MPSLQTAPGALRICLPLVTLAAALFGAGPAAARSETDVYLSGLIVYAQLPPGSAEAEEFGAEPELDEWDLHGGLAPDTIEVVVVVNGERAEPVRLVLEIVPVVGLTNWALTEGVTEPQLLASSKVPLATELRLETTQVLAGRTEVRFGEIALGSIIERYRDLGFWPAELVLRAVAAPLPGETSLANNVMERRLPVHPPD